jgi:hypothetical protein
VAASLRIPARPGDDPLQCGAPNAKHPADVAADLAQPRGHSQRSTCLRDGTARSEHGCLNQIEHIVAIPANDPVDVRLHDPLVPGEQGTDGGGVASASVGDVHAVIPATVAPDTVLHRHAPQ